ncbi:Bro-N domain-containing protein [Thomasclavelia cocleata]|uniref:BRO family, N-terminal domain n=1 Tax=Thomasclavelia cocleata TaxID=69824 RepID=A0A1I0GEM8_9FIRM|nr:BRO family protein [Thomasclavelia cocleata]MCR1959841.1 BRO family protein [Thomasclavelia cocleata]NDO43191.1 hypothetical protein [Thomasclavelia cocleata]SET68479.1 BRO family, N-terminal domain [Thomasclavelia cocleata]
MKETSLQTFNLIESVEILGKKINLYNTVENPLFLARDVAEWIDYAFTNAKRTSRDISKMIKNIDSDEKIKGVCNLYDRKNFPITNEGNNSNKSTFNSFYGAISPSDKTKSKARKTQNMWFLTEDGLYEVLMQSRKPIAKEIKSKIKSYLRDIRKTGGTVEPYKDKNNEVKIDQEIENLEFDIFNFRGFKIRCLNINNVVFFIGKEICDVLGYSNARKAIDDHVDEDDKFRMLKSRFVTLDIPNRGLTAINESGLYSLILSSKLSQAREFKQWVTSEVLPSIRKTGGAIEYGSEEKFIESRFSNFSEDTKRAMVTELLASNKVLQEQNELLETDVKALKSEILTWNDRNKLNAGVRMLAAQTNHYIGTIWKQLYKQLQYKYGIYLNSRKQNKNDSLISRVREEEWGMVMETFNAMCADYGKSPTKMFQQTLNKN